MLESKKYSLIEWIISVADEKIIDSLQVVKDRFEKTSNKGLERGNLKFTSSSYGEILNRTVDIERLKKEQNYKPTSSVELSKIAKEADIKEPIEFLLADLKSIG